MGNRKKRIITFFLVLIMTGSLLTGCGNNQSSGSGNTGGGGGSDGGISVTQGAVTKAPILKDNVTLTLWGAEEDQTILRQMADSFISANAATANITINLGVESEATAKDTILTDIEAAADVFAFADDQLNQLVMAGALQEVTVNKDTIVEANGGAESGTISAASYGDKLYAYPMTADNGYFMFYNKEYFTEEDVKSFDDMLNLTAAAGKKMTMRLDDGWYLYSFFKGAGLNLSLNEDGLTNSCDWNSTTAERTGVEVAQAILDIAKHPGFINLTDAEFVTGLREGTIIAGVSGTWNAGVAEESWGENYAATKLPTYTVAGEQVQMSSFAGYKLVGVNAYSDFVGYAMDLAEWLTNYENQLLRFRERKLGPSNVQAAASEEIQASPAIAALAEQAQFATVQRVGDNYWAPAETFGAIMKAGNMDGTDLQQLLDSCVQGITAPAE